MLTAIHTVIDPVSEEKIAEIAQSNGVPNARARDIRARMEHYQTLGYVEREGLGWRVTQYALSKFGDDWPQEEKTAPPVVEDAVP